MDRLVAAFTAKRPFLCRRCGWRGRRNWTDRDLQQLLEYGAGGAEIDPALTVLDLEHPTPGLHVANDDSIHVERRADLDHSPKAGVAPRRRQRRKGSRRREIVATIAATALVLFLVVILGLTGSCSGTLEG